MKCLLLHWDVAGTELSAVKCSAGRALSINREQLLSPTSRYISVVVFADCVSKNILSCVIIAFSFHSAIYN